MKQRTGLMLIMIMAMVTWAAMAFAATTHLSSISNVKNPLRIAIDSRGYLFVTGSDGLTLCNPLGVCKKSISKQYLSAVAVDQAGMIYLGLEEKQAVLVYNKNFTFARNLGNGAVVFGRPNDIAIDGTGRIYVVDSLNKTVSVFEPTGAFAFAFGNGTFTYPTALTINDAASEIYVTDLQKQSDEASGARIHVFDKNGNFKRSIGTYNSLGAVGTLSRPVGIAVDSQTGTLYVSDIVQNAVLIVDPANGSTSTALYDLTPGRQLASPQGVAIGGNRIVYIAAADSKSIERYGLDGYVTMDTTPSSLMFAATQFGAAPADQSVTIANTGNGLVNWTASKDQPWLTIGGQAAALPGFSGSTGPAGSSALLVGVDVTNLAPGVYKGNVTLSSDSGLVNTIPVSLTLLSAPVVSLSDGWLNFTSKKNRVAAPQPLTVTVANAASLSWSVASDATWLSVAPSTGSATTTASVSINTSGLVVGPYTAYLTLNAPGALGDKSKLAVNLTVQPSTKIAVATNVADAAFTLTGPATYSGFGQSWSIEDVIPGDYTIAYGAVQGYQKPPSQTLTIGDSGELAFSGTYVSDIEDPFLALSTLENGSYTNNGTMNVVGTATDNLALESVRVNGSAVTVNPDGSFSAAVQLALGANLITTTALDTAGNTTTDTRTIVLDQTTPVITMAGPADNSVTNLTEVTMEGTVDKAATVSVQVLGEASVPATMTGNSFSLTVALPYGQNTIQVTATDLAGNAGTVKRTVIFDNVNPTLAVTEPAQDVATNQPGVMLQGAVDDLTAATVIVTIDGVAYTPAVTDGMFLLPLSFTEEKTYAVMVSATDAAENTTTVQRNIIYDKTPPALSIAPASTQTNQPVLTITGATEAGAIVNVQCATAVAGAVSYPSAATWQVQLSGLTEGDNTISVTATDQVGNMSAPVNIVITLDTAPPDTVLANASPALTNRTDVSFAFAATEPGATFECLLDQADYAVCASPALFTGVNDGSHRLLIRAVDPAGNKDPEPATVSWTVDTMPPAAVIVGAPTGPTRTVDAQLSVTGDDVISYRYRIDNGTDSEETPVSALIALAGLADGPHSLSVIGKDSAGNWQSMENAAVATWTFDTQTPSLELSALPNGAYTNNGTMNIAGQASDNLAVGGVTINGSAVVMNADGSFSMALQLALGANLITATAFDTAGNATTDTRTVVLDQTAPTITVEGLPDNSVTNLTEVIVQGTVDKTASVSVQVLGETSVPAAMTGNAFSLNVALPYGRNTIQVTALDLAGNVGTIKRTVLFDNVNPVLAVTDPAQDLITNQPGLTLRGTVDDLTAATVTVTLDGAASEPPVTNGAFQKQIEFTVEKTYAVYVTAVDQVGNATTVQRNIEYRKTPTVLTYTGATLAAQGGTLMLSAVLSSNDSGQPDLSGLPISFTLGSGPDSQFCAGTTDARGTAGCAISPVALPLGSAPVTAAFGGTVEYKPATDARNGVIFSFPAKGAFVIGDKNAVLDKAATFWSAQWSNSNTLSSGAAPAAFKGFADSIGAGTPVCGGAWSADTGNSSAPPASVPSYMAVLVSSAVSKSGSTVSGAIMKIVVVKTGAGYGPDSTKQTGTGTVVGVLCQN